MCGICGKLIFDSASQVSAEVVADMTRMMAHRGPNDEGLHVNGQVGLGHRRLSIVDLAGGHQPISNEEDSAWIVFNGEIYNHADLRKELEAKGHRYKTSTDTETILHAYEEYGVDCVHRLRGMFGFAIWDARHRSLLLARDRFGIKPLYYWRGADRISFSSEMKALLIDPDVDVSLDATALYDFFTFKFIPGPQTPFKEIRRLQPGHFMVVKDGRIQVERYWQPEFNGLSNRSRDDHLEELEHRFKDAIRENLMSEVPQGVFLSGGVDSSLITALMASIIDEPLRTFAVGFEEYQGFDESTYAEQVAAAFRTCHKTFFCRPSSFACLSDALWHIEEPLADAAMIPLYELCRQAARDVTVVHCGDGGDEGFGGYPRFYWDSYAGLYARVPDLLRRGVLAPAFSTLQRLPGPLREIGRRAEKFSKYTGLSRSARYTNWFTLINDDVKHALLTPDFLAEVGQHRSADVFESIFADAARLGMDSLGTNQYCELHSFVPDDLMLKSDKIAMAAGLEGRFPFLDHRLVEFGLSLPPSHQVGYRQLKVLLRQLLARYLPKNFVYRRKQGFEVPVNSWFRTELNTVLRDTIAADEVARDGILNSVYLDGMIRRLHAGDPAAGRQLFAVFVFQRWRKLFEHPKRACREHRNMLTNGAGLVSPSRP
ncbi:MAG: asparagine synthase (glutamine-hydrolyzing) [Candidatus Hydrogenedentes bacterium]|nr:asparagine synthase (glutamine-hydrolyzing) [Candidatus Hydrogenedentota bacterium]